MDQERVKIPQLIPFEEVVRIAKETVLRDGYHLPTLVVEGSREPAILQIAGLANTHEGRVVQLYSAGVELGLGGQLGRLRQVILVTEGWMSMGQDGQEPVLPPSLDPNRKEVLIIAGHNLTLDQTQMVLFGMVRNKRQKLIGLTDLTRSNTGVQEGESLLLQAFIQGYQRSRK